MNRLLAGVAVAATMAASAASANTIYFNKDRNWTQGTHTYSNGTESVDVEAFVYGNLVLPPVAGNPYLASWTGSGGLGICSDPKSWIGIGTNNANACDEDHQVDGSGFNEMAVIDFGSKIVELTEIIFSHVGNNDRYDVFLFGNGTGSAATDSDLNNSMPNSCFTCTVSNFSLGTGSVFGIGAYWGNSEWKIKAVKYDVVPVDPVPLPAAGLLLLGGIGGLAAFRRRAKA